MKNKEMNESSIDVVNGGYEFNGFGDDLYDNFDYDFESPIENVNVTTLDTNKIDELVESEDYMGYQDYLDQLDDTCKHEASEYVENNYPEFLKDEEGNLIEPMKGGLTNKELVDDLKTKPDFDKNIVKDELTKNLFDSYKNAA